jgi:hypothetical protein
MLALQFERKEHNMIDFLKTLRFLKPTEQEIDDMINNSKNPFRVFDYIWEHGFVMGISVGFGCGVVTMIVLHWVTK